MRKKMFPMLALVSQLGQRNHVKVLHIAAEFGYGNALGLLLRESGVDVNAKDERGYTALHIAACHGRMAAAQMLVTQFAADVDVKSEEGETPLHVAIRNQHTDIVKWLVSKGADVNAKTKEGQTALHLAVAAFEEANVTKWLTSMGADVFAKNKNGEVPFEIGLKEQRMDAVKWLWTAAYSKLKDLEKETNSPVLATLKQWFITKESNLANIVLAYVRPATFGDLKFGNENTDSEIKLLTTLFEDLSMHVKMLEEEKKRLKEEGTGGAQQNLKNNF